MSLAKFNKDMPVAAALPKRIERLNDLAYNLWWAWNPDAVDLFKQIDPVIWNSVTHSPIEMLKRTSRAVFNQKANDKEFIAAYDAVLAAFDAYMTRKDTWFATHYPNIQDKTISYFSFEFGLHESIPAYAGGLGILAGDHLKESSDMGLPLVAIGFIYNEGYFVQKITEDGWQETSNFHLDFSSLPMIPLTDEKGKNIIVSVSLPGRDIYARAWMMQVGRVPLYLLDTSIDENSPYDRQLTAKLYTSADQIGRASCRERV